MVLKKNIYIIFLWVFCLQIGIEAKEFFYFKNHDEILKFVKNYLPLDPKIIDAGAYDCSDSLRMTYVWPQSQIYAFEPIPENYRLAIKKIKNTPNIICFPYALSEKDGFSKMIVSEWTFKPGKPSESSSILPPKDHLKYCNVVKFPNSIEVQTYTLDSWAKIHNIEKIDMLWLDLQGVELNVLKASPNILSTVKIILSEVEFVEAYEGQYLYDDVKNWLENENFILVGADFNILNPKENGRWFGNALFIKKEIFQ